MDKSPKLGEYDGKGDLKEHVQLVNDWLSYFGGGNGFKCKLFALNLTKLTWLWFNGMPDGSIDS